MLLAKLAQRFRKAGVVDTTDAVKLLDMAASAAPGMLGGILEVAGELCGGELIDELSEKVPTFGKLAEDWTSGDLHQKYSDHVRAKKDTSLDESRLAKLCAIDVGGVKLGEIPLDRFKLDHAEAAMRQLPEEAKRPGTRRHYAQLINRVLSLAVYPCRIIDSNPLPKGFMPKAGKPPTYPFLYPSDDAKLMPCGSVPLPERLLFGFLAREGMRFSEAMRLQFKDLDLVNGTVSLDANKTDDPRMWALAPGVLATLRV